MSKIPMLEKFAAQSLVEYDGELIFSKEKFAELIVRECARVAIEKQTENDIEGIVSKNPAKDFAYALIKHFGVEE